MEYSSLFVTLMGIGTVFFGLICIIFLTMAMGAILKGKEKAPAAAAAAPAAAYGTIGELSPVLTTRISLEDSLFFAALLV